MLDNVPSNRKPITGIKVTDVKDPVTRAGNFMALHAELDRLEDMIIEGGPRVFGHTVIDEEKICRQIDQVRLAIPESIAKAEEILQYRDQLIADAEEYVEKLVKKAQTEAQRLVEESVIVRQAELEATQIRRRTQEECDQLRLQTLQEIEQMRRQAQAELELIQQQVRQEVDMLQRSADDYCDRNLASLESQLLEMLRVVQNGRKSLQGRSYS
ncbi:MAG: hypothetical protein ACK4QL_02095 [Pseudanabaenaceae cyanobacterium]